MGASGQILLFIYSIEHRSSINHNNFVVTKFYHKPYLASVILGSQNQEEMRYHIQIQKKLGLFTSIKIDGLNDDHEESILTRKEIL